MSTDSGIISITMSSFSPMEAAQILFENYGIISRYGLHCSPLIHKSLGTTKSGTLRLSLSGFNTFSEIETVISGLRKLAK